MMQIELRKIQYHAALSEETNCYSAQLWVDGKHVADVANRGHGAPDEQHPVNGMTCDGLQKLNEQVKAERGVDKTYGIDVPIDLDIVCSDLLTDHLIGRDLKRGLSKRVMWIAKDGKVYGVKKCPGQELAQMTALKAKHGFAKSLNEMDFPTALAAFKAAA